MTMTSAELETRLPDLALAFRGYNVTNLGRSHELLRHPQYGGLVGRRLREASQLLADTLGEPVDLTARVDAQRETSLANYTDAIVLVSAMELVQLELLGEFFGIDYRGARLSLGYSLGEIAASVAGGVVALEAALEAPLRLAADCVALADGVSLAVLFSRGDPLKLEAVTRLCLQTNQVGRATMGVSAILSPNSMLLMGQGDTLARFRQSLPDEMGSGVHLRRNRGAWPPLHTPIMWERNIPNRSAVMMHRMPGGMRVGTPPVLSLVTGKLSYTDSNFRDVMHRWVDHPQRLWDAIYEVFALGIETVLHVGPAPNILPATFKRLRDNVEAQTRGSVGMRALSAVVHRPWLKALLPERTALLRATSVQQVILEDWLLDQQVP
ncbi:MAG: ACP S-malonyltransferase [Planctomycetaceae bacterium]|nr:ACP S-malonyltransferase [Planctomycetaceae bacterium]